MTFISVSVSVTFSYLSSFDRLYCTLENPFARRYRLQEINLQSFCFIGLLSSIYSIEFSLVLVLVSVSDIVDSRLGMP